MRHIISNVTVTNLQPDILIQKINVKRYIQIQKNNSKLQSRKSYDSYKDISEKRHLIS